MKISIGQAVKLLGVSHDTLRRWEKAGKIHSERTKKGHRRYNKSELLGLNSELSHKKTLAYARVSSHDQKEDLQRQVQLLESFCASKGWPYEVIEDLGSGLNYHKKGLRKLIQAICLKGIDRLILTHKDRLKTSYFRKLGFF